MPCNNLENVEVDDILDWLAEHDQAWKDIITYFGSEDAVMEASLDDIVSWISDHEELSADFENKFSCKLEEAIKPNIESDELQALAKKHNIKILDAMNNGDLRMEGAGADLMKFYQEAAKKGLWEVDSELYEALYGFDELNRFTKKAKEVGLETFGDIDNFLKRIKQPGESEMQALDRYRKELGYSFTKADKYYDMIPKQFYEIAARCGLEISEFDDFIENELVKQNIPVNNANLIKAIKKYEVELNEATMSDLDIEIQEAGGKDSWKQKALEQLAEMESSLSYLVNYVPKYVNAGSNYDSIEELNADIAELEKDITNLKAKISLLK